MGKKRPWKSADGKFMVYCIFHNDKTPSLRVWPNGKFYCLGCHMRGTVKDYSTLYSILNILDPEYSTQLKLFDV